MENAAARKIQKYFKKKTVYTNGTGWKYSESKITNTIVRASVSTDFSSIINEDIPKGFTEVTGYSKVGQKGTFRYIKSHGWIGESKNLTKIVAKYNTITVILTKNAVNVLGSGNYEQGFLLAVRNGWAPKSLLHMKPEYLKITGSFKINRRLDLNGLYSEVHSKISNKIVHILPYDKELFPAVFMTFKVPKIQLTFFENGTVKFTGIKDIKDINVPKNLFKGILPVLDLNAISYLGAYKNIPMNMKKGVVAAKKLKLAARYAPAFKFDAVPPAGFYVRPGTDGAPRFYPYQHLQKGGNGALYSTGNMNLAPVKPRVIAAFEKAGVPIPARTKEIFGITNTPPSEKKKYMTQRANSFNSVKNGYYVRPGPGKQPYFFKIPTGIATARKTVEKLYSEAGINIPKEVRKIFKISNSLVINTNPTHKITIGMNKAVRINGRQASRLTKKQLIQIARNMNIAKVDDKMKPIDIINYILVKSGINTKVNKSYDVNINSVQYKFIQNGKKIQKTSGLIRTTRNWATLPKIEQNKIAKAFLPKHMHANYNALPKNDTFDALLAIKSQMKIKSISPTSSSVNSNSFAKEIEMELKTNAMRNKLKERMGNNFRNENVKVILNQTNKLVKQTEINKVMKQFVKEKKFDRSHGKIVAAYSAKIVVPNWINKKNAYKQALINAGTQVNAKGKYPTQKAVKEAMAAWVASHGTRGAHAAYNKENAVTGKKIHVPAYIPPKIQKIVVPKLSPIKKASPKVPKVLKTKLIGNSSKVYKFPANKNNVNSLANNLISKGLSTKNSYSWKNLVAKGVDKKFRNTWFKLVS